MYESYWKLSQSPFQSGFDPEHVYTSSAHDEALARLEFLVDNSRRLGLVVGPTGCGKSILLEVFARQLRRRGLQVATLNMFGIEERELLWNVAQQFGALISTEMSHLKLWKTVTDLIAEHRYQEQKTVLLCDDASEASEAALTQIIRLACSHVLPDDRLTIVLVAKSDGVHALGASLLERVEIKVEMEPWKLTDTIDYLRSSKNGERSDHLFTPDAERRLHELAAGVPRRINQIADLCLLAGVGGGLYQIDAVTVENVYHELDVHVDSGAL